MYEGTLRPVRSNLREIRRLRRRRKVAKGATFSENNHTVRLFNGTVDGTSFPVVAQNLASVGGGSVMSHAGANDGGTARREIDGKRGIEIGSDLKMRTMRSRARGDSL